MNTTTLALSAFTGFAAATVALAPTALAMPSGTASAQHTVTTTFEGNGGTVRLGRVGGTPLPECTMIAAPPGRDISPLLTTDPGYAPVQQMLPTTSYVDVTC